MVASFAYTLILGKPIIFYLGILTLLSFLLTASIGYASTRGITGWLPFKYHPKLALISLVLALIHGFLGLSVYLGF